MEYFDVIIVGGGPAGLRCAEILGSSDTKVLLLEKNKKIGPKVCAGGISRKTIDLLNLPDELIDFGYSSINFHTNGACTQISNEKEFVFTIDREKLGQWQLKRLKKFKNITIRTGSPVRSISKDYVFLNNKKIRYKILVGADGSNSFVRKYLGLNSNNIGIAMQYIIKNKKYTKFEVFFNPKLFSSGYAWIFPHGKYASVGCGFIQSRSKGNLYKNFSAWLRQKDIDLSNARYEAFTYNHEYKGHKFQDIFIVGDAAGFMSSFTGEGIYQALVSGEEVAKTILDNNYESDKIKELLLVKDRHNIILDLLTKSGIFRSGILHGVRILLKNPYFRKKAIELLA